MGSKTINTILNMQDRMSPKLIGVSKRVKTLDKDTQRATAKMANMANKFTASVDKMVGKAAKMAGIGATLLAGLSIKTGFGEAMDMEGYRTQLETATKSTKKAGQIMKWAVNLANKTPFEAGPVIEMASKYEAMGLSAKKWGGITADMAGATNKDVIQATEAVIDAQTGELERLKEFGITKAIIAKKAAAMFKHQEIINAKGQIVDQKKFNEAMMAVMEERFKGGAAALSKTTKGMWSTVTGVTKTSLANLVGMQNDGTIKSGSMLDKLKSKIQQLADKLTKWQNDGTLDRMGKKFTETFTKIYLMVSKTYKFIKKHQDIILFFGTFAVSLVTVAKAVTIAQSAIKGLGFAFAIVDGAFKLTTVGKVVLVLSALIAVGVLVYKNWDKITSAVKKAWGWFENLIDGIPDVALCLAGPIAPLLLLIKHFDKVKKAIKGAWGWLKKFGKDKSDSKSDKKSEKQSTYIEKYGHNALGTSYWKGGRTAVNEHGDEIIDLPSGSRVIPADKSTRIMNQNGQNHIEININGVGKSTKEILDEMVPALKLALANM